MSDNVRYYSTSCGAASVSVGFWNEMTDLRSVFVALRTDEASHVQFAV